jgi:hypothetical protein
MITRFTVSDNIVRDPELLKQAREKEIKRFSTSYIYPDRRPPHECKSCGERILPSEFVSHFRDK